MAPGLAASLALASLTALVMPTLHGVRAASTPTATPVSAAAVSSGSLAVRLDVTLNLSGLHPAATKGALECGAVAQTRSWVDGHRDGLIDYDSVSRSVLSPAHYFGQKAQLEFPIANRSYAGTQTFITTIGPPALIDPATHARFAPSPTVLVACWLWINGRPAAWDPGAGLLVVSSSNFTSVNQKPLAIAVADAGMGTSVATASQLSAQGLFFNPGPVSVAGNVPLGGATSSTPIVSGPSRSTVSASGSGTLASTGSTSATPTASGLPRSTLPVTPPSVSAATAPPPSTISAPSVAPVTPALATANSPASVGPSVGAGTSGNGSPGSTAPSNPCSSFATTTGKGTLSPVPAITGLTATSTDPATHAVTWACYPAETGCFGPATGAPSYAYSVWMQDPVSSRFTQFAQPQAAQGSWTTQLTAFLAAPTTFRVCRSDASNKFASASWADFVYAAPPQPQEPTEFTAIEPQFGQVLLNWKPVPNAAAYRLFEKGANTTAPPARFTTTTATLNAVAPGSHTYELATEYRAGYPTANLPEASVVVHGMPPPHGVAFLSRRGVGTAAAATLHAIQYLGSATADLNHDSWDGPGSAGGTAPVTISSYFGLVVGWDGIGETAQFVAPTAAAQYANVTELGLGRSVACWQWPNRVLPAYTLGLITLCIAGSHGVPGGPRTPDGSALYQSAGWTPESIGVIVTSPTMGQFFAHLVWDPSDAVGTHNPLSFGDPKWGAGWTLSLATVLDSEGPKYTPHACMACHGGTFDSTTGRVTGASLLPIDPGLVVFGSQPGSDRAASEEGVRSLNAMVAASNPAPAVANYIQGLYNGQVANAGSVAQADYVPTGWSQQSDVFRLVVKRDCIMCHLTAPTALTFDSWAGFSQYAVPIKVDVCSVHSMPNAEVPYNNFWSASAPIGNTTVNLGGYMLASLGITSCP